MLGGYVSNGKEFYARSRDGLWVRSRFNADVGTVDLAWQVRHRIDRGFVVKLDENGDEMGRTSMLEAEFGNEWIEVASVSLDDSKFIEMSPPQMLGHTIKGFMVHAATMLASGWGEDADEVASWFIEPWKGDFIMGEYLVTRPILGFEDGEGMLLSVSEWSPQKDGCPIGEGILKGEWKVRGGPETYPMELERERVPAAMLVATIPQSK